MFSRFRMNPIVETQGSDWDWLLQIAASGTEEGKKKEREAAYQRTVQDHRQLLLQDSASSLQTNTKSAHSAHVKESGLHRATHRLCRGWPPFCLSSPVPWRCSPEAAGQSISRRTLREGEGGRLKQAANQQK